MNRREKDWWDADSWVGINNDQLKHLFNRNKSKTNWWLVVSFPWMTIGIAIIVFRDVVFASMPKWMDQACALVFLLGIFVLTVCRVLLIVRQGDMEREMQRRNMRWNYSLVHIMMHHHDRKKS